MNAFLKFGKRPRPQSESERALRWTTGHEGASLFGVDLRRRLDNGLIFAVGDVHGRYDLLENAVDLIRSYPSRSRKFVIMLGDYIDRGAESCRVVEFLSTRLAARLTCLKGNHEQMLVSAAESRDPKQLRLWLANGGDQTLRSYGGVATVESLDLIPEKHMKWLQRLPHIATDGHRLYVHAGLVPGELYVDQSEEDFLWIREKFLRRTTIDDFPDGLHIVHGHTPEWEGKVNAAAPELLGHRTNLDTGAYATGTLTVGVFSPDQPGGPIDVLAVRSG